MGALEGERNVTFHSPADYLIRSLPLWLTPKQTITTQKHTSCTANGSYTSPPAAMHSSTINPHQVKDSLLICAFGSQPNPTRFVPSTISLISPQSWWGQTPLCFPCKCGCYETMALLILFIIKVLIKKKEEGDGELLKQTFEISPLSNPLDHFKFLLWTILNCQLPRMWGTIGWLLLIWKKRSW